MEGATAGTFIIKDRMLNKDTKSMDRDVESFDIHVATLDQKEALLECWWGSLASSFHGISRLPLARSSTGRFIHIILFDLPK